MTPIVILLLFTLMRYPVCGCPSKNSDTSGRLLKEAKGEQTHEFCCVFSAAVVLRDAWLQLLKHLHKENYIYVFITSMIELLKNITEEHQQRFLEKPDLSIFPPVSSSPEDLLSFTADLLSRWEALPCTEASVTNCEFHPAAPEEDDEEDDKVPSGASQEPRQEPPVEQGPSSQSQKDTGMTAAPSTNRGAALLFHFPGHVVVSLWGIFLLWTALTL
ncbi:uncharacterized protein zgc:174888 isoform X2 [Engraulis encrasicolus]|uniref:uncharacterized protein zgc:174888 isoform X2 n=1 Tax=Engraulis encrasicolus TaxID=184585 RepID=UPI002FCEED91